MVGSGFVLTGTFVQRGTEDTVAGGFAVKDRLKFARETRTWTRLLGNPPKTQMARSIARAIHIASERTSGSAHLVQHWNQYARLLFWNDVPSLHPIVGTGRAAVASALLGSVGVSLGGWLDYLLAGFIGACILIGTVSPHFISDSKSIELNNYLNDRRNL